MSINKEKTAIIIQTNTKVKVYRLNRGTWCNSNDCTTEYLDKELKFI